MYVRDQLQLAELQMLDVHRVRNELMRRTAEDFADAVKEAKLR